MRDYEHGIEIARKSHRVPNSLFSIITFGTSVTRLVYQAEFILDITTFKVLKHRYGNAGNLTPNEAAKWLTHYLDNGARVLLLTD